MKNKISVCPFFRWGPLSHLVSFFCPHPSYQMPPIYTILICGPLGSSGKTLGSHKALAENCNEINFEGLGACPTHVGPTCVGTARRIVLEVPSHHWVLL